MQNGQNILSNLIGWTLASIKKRASIFVGKQMVNPEEYKELKDKRYEAKKDMKTAIDELEKKEDLQRKVLISGSLFILVATGVASVFSFPGISKFGGFICAIVLVAISLLFVIFNYIIGIRIKKAKVAAIKQFDDYKEKLEAPVNYIAICIS